MIQTYVSNGERYGIDIEYVFEDEPLGTVGPLAQMDHLDQSFLVMNGDVITNLNYSASLSVSQGSQGASYHWNL